MPSVAVILALCFLNRQTQSQSPPQAQCAKLSQISHLNARGCKGLTINCFLACDCWGAQQNAVIIMSTSLDPLLFPFRPNLGKHDTTIYMLQRVYACLDSNSCIMGITFDFSRPLNTIHLLLLKEKLRKNISKQVNYTRFTDQLTHRLQYVRPGSVIWCSTGAPRGTVLSPFLLTLHPSEFQQFCVICPPASIFQILFSVVNCSSTMHFCTALQTLKKM